MPPTNSPSVTPPESAAPGTIATSSSEDSYLRQLEEAISTPVPDLASTLRPIAVTRFPRNTARDPSDRNREDLLFSARLADEWGGDPPASRGDGSRRPRHEPARDESLGWRPYLTEVEFQNQSEQIGRTATMQSQRSRTRPGFASSEEREGQRRRYATTGEGPRQQSLYDWAVTVPPSRGSQDINSGDDSDQDMEDMSTAASNIADIAGTSARGEFRRLERALSNYRAARNALRTGRSADVGAVPTASALRIYRNGESVDVDMAGRTAAGTGLFSSEYRQERQRRYAEYMRLQQNDRTGTGFQIASRLTTRAERKRSEALTRVKNTIRYLSQLRHTGVQGGLELARQLDLDSLYESEEANTPSDLPMHVNSLPIPQYSSWLEPGMVWHGLQSTDREPVRAPSSQTRSARDFLRRTFARRREMDMGNVNPDPNRLPADSLVDADRFLSDLLQDANGRWGLSPPSASPLASHPAQPPSQDPESDHWPVKVAIHSVDYDTMTLTGTMSASHMPEKLGATQQQGAPQPYAPSHSMSSFFTGEIIDFRQQPLETEAEGRDYRVGGLDTDAHYWARLGPFRKEIEKVRSLRGKRRSEYHQDSRLWEAFRKAAGAEGENKDQPGRSRSGAASSSSSSSSSSTEPEPEASSASATGAGAGYLGRTTAAAVEGPEESKEAEDDAVMARCLASAKWIEENLGREWILMRWKERCFLTASGPGASAPDSSLNPIDAAGSSSPLAHSQNNNNNNNDATSWGLTISGFYYIALNRLTGEIDGLYYDPGSQPYQALRMVPEGTSLRGLVLPTSNNAAPQSQIPSQSQPQPQTKPDLHNNRNVCVCGCGDTTCKERVVGLKKWFPSVELR
ncbi:hypothetical protein ABEF95_014414 [Exophiala dermatitidis]